MKSPERVSKGFSPVSFTKVKISDDFWSPRMRVNREQTIPHSYLQCKETGRIDAFKLEWKPGMEPVPHVFWDSDVAKWVEAASYCLAENPDPELDELMDEVTALIASAQQPDGYLNTHYTAVEPEKRWTNLRDCHELYCAGHLMEAAVAHYQATGKRTLLDALCRYADHIDSVFGTKPGKKRGYCGHEEIELALVKLYRATGNERYLRLSEYFVNERGQKPNYFDVERIEREGTPGFFDDGKRAFDYRYNQSHVPVREQDEVVGHAVRAIYLYSAMTDLAGELGDDSLLRACERLWNNVCLKRMYVTGGIGPSRHNEGFTNDYDLPNESAYAETCAAAGLIFWMHRMLQLDCDGRYADVMERALYNGALSGVSLDGKKFFYVNPLASGGNHHREEWFGCACCPPNIARLLASVGEYIYSQSEDGVAVHLYVDGEMNTKLSDGTGTRLKQDTRYPWDGQIKITLEVDKPVKFTLRLRIPNWCRKHSLKVKSEVVSFDVDKGYALIRRNWQSGDVVELELDMPVERVKAHPEVEADQGRSALQRGPLVYCLEDADHTVNVKRIIIASDAELVPRFDPDLLGGVVVIEGEGLTAEKSAWEGKLYQPANGGSLKQVPVRAVPYYAWDNREPGGMVVWIPQTY